jgi:hypothetical protein
VPDELDLLKSLGRGLAEPDEESVERARHLLEERTGSHVARVGSRPRLRWWLVVAAVGLLIGSGLGFGIASSLTPSGTAGGNVVGLGFIPVEGWTVTQTGAIEQSGVARAVAANVPFDADDQSSSLRALPPTGAVIVARFSPRGDERRDASFGLRKLPLRIADAVPADLPSALSETSLVSLQIRGGVGGYNVAASVFFGGPPSPAMLGGVDEQLRRLVVAPSAITLSVHPRILSPNDRLSIFGSISSGKADQKVAVQFKACGVYPVQFRDVFETTTEPGGGYSLAHLQPVNLGVSGVFRAISGDSISAAVPVYQRAFVYLRPARGGRFEAGVSAVRPFWRSHVLLQRYERGRGGWVTLRRLVLTEQLGGGGPAPPFQSVVRVTVVTAPFRPAVPKGTRIRAVFPLAQAKPCYLAGISEPRRT